MEGLNNAESCIDDRERCLQNSGGEFHAPLFGLPEMERLSHGKLVHDK